MSDAVIVALVSGVVALASAIFSYVGSQNAAKRTSDLIVYRIEKLEEKQSKHNNLIERMFRVESKLETAVHDINELKGELNDGR